jgi:hypothetical protein
MVSAPRPWTLAALLFLAGAVVAVPARGQAPPPGQPAPPGQPTELLQQAPQQVPAAPLFGGLFPEPPVLLPPGEFGPLPGLGVPPVPPDTRTFVLRGSVLLDGSYTDNFFRSSTQPEAEYREILAPTFDVQLRPGQAEFRLLYTPTVVHSSLTQSESDLRVFHLLNAVAAVPLSDRFTLEGADTFVETDNPTITDPSGVRRGQTVLTSEVFATRLLYQQDRWSLAPKYSLTFSDNRTEGAEAPAGSTTTSGTTTTVEQTFVQTIGMDGTRNLSERSLLGATYEYTTARFQVAEDFVSHFGRLSLTRDINPVLIGKVEASVTDRIFVDSGALQIYRTAVEAKWNPVDFYVLVGRAGWVHGDFGANSADDAEYSLASTYSGSWVQLSLVSSRTLKDTTTQGVNGGFIKTDDYGVRVRFLPTDVFTVEVGGHYQDAVYVQTVGTTVNPTTSTTTTTSTPQRHDHTIEATLDATYRLTRMLSLILGYAYTNTKSNEPGLSFSANRVHLGLLVKFE